MTPIGINGEMACHPAWGECDNPPLFADGKIAQLVEQRTENPRVLGSIPSLATTFSDFREVRVDKDRQRRAAASSKTERLKQRIPTR
jgi:hypothetical protein